MQYPADISFNSNMEEINFRDFEQYVHQHTASASTADCAQSEFQMPSLVSACHSNSTSAKLELEAIFAPVLSHELFEKLRTITAKFPELKVYITPKGFERCIQKEDKRLGRDNFCKLSTECTTASAIVEDWKKNNHSWFDPASQSFRNHIVVLPPGYMDDYCAIVCLLGPARVVTFNVLGEFKPAPDGAVVANLIAFNTTHWAW